jgi:hypothetical protein
MVRSNGLPSELSVRSSGPELAPGTRVTIREVLGQIPDVAELYERTFEEHPRRLRCEVQITGLPEPDLVDAVYSGEIPADQELRRQAWLGIVPTRAGLPSSGWIAGLLGDRVRQRETGANLLHFAREPVNKVAESHLFDLYYDAGTQEHPRLDMPVTTNAYGEEYLVFSRSSLLRMRRSWKACLSETRVSTHTMGKSSLRHTPQRLPARGGGAPPEELVSSGRRSPFETYIIVLGRDRGLSTLVPALRCVTEVRPHTSHQAWATHSLISAILALEIARRLSKKMRRWK